jgi:RHS repeat-associated protein
LLSNGQVKLWRLSDWAQLGSTYTISGFQANQVVTLGIRANSTTISVEVDGVTRISVTDGSFSSGEVGLWSYDPSSANQHVFDDFLVQNLGQGSIPGGKVVAAQKALAQPRTKTAPHAEVMPKSAFTLTRQAGQVWKSYYYAGAARIAMREENDEGSEVYYILTDHLGSTSITVNDAGQRTAQAWYKPWGEAREVWGVLPTDRTFQGRLDPGWGLKHFGARWFDSSLGRFAQADSIIPGAGNPLAWDRYAGLGNNPVRYTDPSGHMQACADGDEGGGCGYGANTEQIYTTFDKKHGGQYDGLFAEYYALLHEADLALFKGDPLAETIALHATVAKQRAFQYVPQSSIDPAMLIDPQSLLSFSQALVSLGEDLVGLGAGIIINPKPGSALGATAGKPFSKKVKEEAFSENPTKTCVYCRRPGTGTQVDHAIPKSKGGNATIDNAQLACPHCNSSKGNRDYPVSPPPGYEGPWPLP